jgi:hypothetical protein
MRRVKKLGHIGTGTISLLSSQFRELSLEKRKNLNSILRGRKSLFYGFEGTRGVEEEPLSLYMG